MKKQDFPINSSYKIKQVLFKNRTIMPAIGTNFSDPQGFVTEKSIHFYNARALGGVGAIVHELCAVDPLGKVTSNMSCIYDDRYIPGFKELAKTVKQTGCKLLLQLNHAGRQTLPMYIDAQPVAPSAVPCPRLKEVPRELSREEIHRLSDQYAAAARRAMAAGFDGVEIQMGHGYLICQFLSLYANKRTDEYGGTLENRARFALEVARKTRKATSHDFLISCKISADEYVNKGLHIKDSIVIAQLLEAQGIDCITVSACNYESAFFNIPVYYLRRGRFLHLARQIKQAVQIPVVSLGKIDNLHYANDVLKKGVSDFVAMGRSLIADPLFIRKSLDNQEKTIRPCLRCNHCLHSLTFGQLECAVNPEVGRESNNRFNQKAGKPKKIAVIGGGPAGLNTAIYAREKGHQVCIFDENTGGGQLNRIGKFPYKKGFLDYRNYLLHTAKHAGVIFKFNSRVEPGKPDSPDPGQWDRLIFCCGAEPDISITGVEGINDIPYFTVDEIVEKGIKNAAIVVIGGGQEGCETANYLAKNKNRVILIEKRHRLAVGLEPILKYHLEKKLKQQGVRILTRARVIKILPSAIVYKTRKEQQEIRNFTYIVMAVGRKARKIPIEIDTGLPPVKIIGDQQDPGKIRDAVHGAYSLFFPGGEING